ncbi:hypothetical protein TYRP_012703 [Tyrophagus putrescentiae]|nr:hypothetical protein TYRP_012703 [Tyrophagus putrescentiae]
MDPLQEKLAKTKLKKMQTKITFDLDLVKHLQKEVIKLSKSVVRLTAEVEELSTDIGDEEDGADGSLYSGPNVCYVKLGLARYRRQLRELVGEVVEQIDERKRTILQLLTAAEARTEELVKARADFEAAQLKLKKEQEEQEEKALKKKRKEEAGIRHCLQQREASGAGQGCCLLLSATASHQPRGEGEVSGAVSNYHPPPVAAIGGECRRSQFAP